MACLLAPPWAPSARGYEESNGVGTGPTTHQVLMDRVSTVLDADGHAELAAFLEANAATLKAGTVRADWTLFDSREHYMDPYTGAGLGWYRSAGSLGREHALLAQEAWRSGDHWEALENLGRVLHLIQDLTVPHHARLTPLDHHAEYEAWVTDHLDEVPTPDRGVYVVDMGNATSLTDPYPWIAAAGRASYPRFHLVDGPDRTAGRNFSEAATELVPLAVALSAGYSKAFFEALDAGPPTVSWSVPRDARTGSVVEMSCLRCGDDSGVVRYTWTLDGTTRLFGTLIRVAFPVAGVVPISLEAIDLLGKKTNLSGEVRVVDAQAPVDLSSAAGLGPFWWLVPGLLLAGTGGTVAARRLAQPRSPSGERPGLQGR